MALGTRPSRKLANTRPPRGREWGSFSISTDAQRIDQGITEINTKEAGLALTCGEMMFPMLSGSFGISSGSVALTILR